MIGISDGFTWKYRALSDELIIMSRCHCIQLKTYPAVGQPVSPRMVQEVADRKVQEDFADLKDLEQQARVPTRNGTTGA
ncbi:MAG: hypothetical protein O7F71_02720 [Gammaproteobacteria bacterium]|nr:hypothetical protein [Gammaproteobacteria bacterium]